jgi:uncharacterized membrane protein YphA (DoxX/SURF4 family)
MELIMGKLEQYYNEAKGNKWFRWFTVFCRIVLALGFIPSGIVKITGERFTALPSNHPLGHYFDALHQTGFYYTFLGIGQLLTALLLLIPRTALLGALMYFPAILNICILAYATRFEGTRITTLMLLAHIYLLCWDYDRIKHILPFKQPGAGSTTKQQITSSKFPFAFFGAVVATAAAVIIINIFIFEIRPGNSAQECENGSKDSQYPKAANAFCDCIYNKGKPLDSCLKEYEMEKEDGSK